MLYRMDTPAESAFCISRCSMNLTGSTVRTMKKKKENQGRKEEESVFAGTG